MLTSEGGVSPLSKAADKPSLLARNNMLKKKKLSRVGYEAQYDPRIVSEMPEAWHPDTHPCVSLKTLLRTDRTMKSSKPYRGVLRLDVECEEFHYDEHFSFIETTEKAPRRNPHVFNGRYITITRRDDGSLRPNFRQIGMGRGFNIDGYAIAVCNELRQALKGLVGE